MVFRCVITLICILSLGSFTTFASPSPDDRNLKTYIVHVEPPESQIFTNSDDLDSWYSSFLPSTPTSSSEEPRMIYPYHSVLKGFAAKLSPEEVKEMEKKDGFVSASPDKEYSWHTTHTPDFLGLHQNLGFWKDSNFGKGVIIGVLDGGIFPDHPSFSDVGMPAPPAKWKGRCDSNFTTVCNNKLIGAKSFVTGSIFSGTQTPLDENGHGTHTASTAAGSFVEGANVFGLANGTAVGMAPLAHLAVYKVCNIFGRCYGSDILAGMDAAIEDGVDVLSISLGGISRAFYEDGIAIGAYSAIEKGIFVSCSAGNSGPYNETLSNEAPWILTVGASTIDRKLKATAMLGSNESFDGESGFQPQDFPATMLPLVYPGLNESDFNARYCFRSSLNFTAVRGKIVLCRTGGGESIVQTLKDAGVAAVIVMNPRSRGFTTFSYVVDLPTIHVSFQDGEKIIDYICSTENSTTTPTATITYKGTVIGDVHAPAVASFSSRGPSGASPGILKPDIIGPGVNILAAWPFSVENNTDTKANFNIISGTSMSCPHLSGIAALLKSAHPDWSPAAIKSAIMTTADQVNLGNQPFEDQWQLQQATIFAIGAGHVNPSKANNPGLIYDIQPEDYIPYLCGLNYTNRQVGVFLQRKINCSEELSIPEAQLNYPSLSIKMGSTPQTYTRTVTNVGDPISTYTVEIFPPAGVDIKVEPSTLSFTELNQKLSYQVTFSSSAIEVDAPFSEGYLKWTSAKYSVRSPIAIIFRYFF